MVLTAYYSMKVKGVFLTISLLVAVVDAVPSLVLSSVPSSSEPFCPGPVLFTCNATNISAIFHWELNDIDIGEYTFLETDQYPLELTVTSPLIDSIQVIDATVDVNSIDIISTLNVSDVLVLNGSSIHCEDLLQRESNEANIAVISPAPPPVPAPNCSLLGGPEVILQWSDVFNRDHVVYKYRVSVSPSLPSCPNTLEVGPDQDYTCSGLEIGQQYNISFAAFNCQQGETDTYSFQLEAPDPPSDVKLVNETSFQWMEVATPLFSVNCTFNNTMSYLVIVQDNSGEMITNRTVFSESCKNGVCSTSFPSSDRNCRVTVRASNLFGESVNADFAIIGSAKYTSADIGLMVVGLILWFIAVVIFVVTLVKGIESFISKCTSCRKFECIPFTVCILCCISFLLLVVSLCMWAATWAHVEQQEDTCDPSWQSIRNRLSISAHVISDITLLVVFIISFFFIMYLIPQYKSVSKPNKPEEDTKLVDVSNTPQEEQHSTAKPAQDPNNGNEIAEDICLIETGASLGESELIMPPSSAAVGERQGIEEEEPVQNFRETGEFIKTAVHRLDEDNYRKHVECPCHSVMKLNEHLQKYAIDPPPQQVAAWIMKYRKWPEEDLSEGKQLQVYFMNNCPGEWKYQGNKIDAGFIMEIIQGNWRDCFIISTSKEEASIRVNFKGSNWSALGSLAKAIPTSEPTMVLDFTAFDHETIKATVIHQFGHALGLGHVLMDPGDWAILKKYVDMEKMMKSLGVLSEKDLEVQWAGKGLSEVNRDPSSVMQYCTSLSWMSQDHVSSSVSSKDKKVLRKLNKHAKIYQQKLSDRDKQTIDMLIGKTEGQGIQSHSQDKTKELTMDELTCLRNRDGSGIFNLTEVVSSFWESLGKELGMPLKQLEDMRVQNDTDYKRMERVWKMWLEHNQDLSQIEKYPPTDVGLNTLLRALDKEETFSFANLSTFLKQMTTQKQNVGAQAALKYVQFK